MKVLQITAKQSTATKDSTLKLELSHPGMTDVERARAISNWLDGQVSLGSDEFKFEITVKEKDNGI